MLEVGGRTGGKLAGHRRGIHKPHAMSYKEAEDVLGSDHKCA